MKILCTNFHGRNGGGHVTYIVNLLLGLGAQHEFTVATPSTSRLYRHASGIQGVKMVDIPYTTRPSSWLRPRAQLRALIKREQVDVIHVNGSADHKQVMLAVLGIHPRPRIIFTKHNDHSLKSFGNWLRARFTTDCVIAVSDFVKDLVLDSPYKHCEIRTIRNGIDTDFFSPVSAQEKLALRQAQFGSEMQDKFVLVSTGGTDFEKGWLDLVAGVALLPVALRQRFHIVVAGNYPEAAQLGRVESLGMTPQVSFPGLIDDVRSVLATGDIGFVLSYREALSYACRELMGLGLPVLVTRVGGLPENLVENQSGWIVPAQSPEQIALILAKVLEQPEVLKQMGQCARQHAVQHFQLADFVRLTLAAYRGQPVGQV
jgi:glycosyltransferase involved in cell wall biosynthesis